MLPLSNEADEFVKKFDTVEGSLCDLIDELNSQSPQFQLAAVNCEPMMIIFIQDPPENLVNFALGMNPSLIIHIEQPSEENLMVAISHQPSFVEYLNKLPEEVKSLGQIIK